MRIRSLLLTSATSVGLLLAAPAFLPEAYAQKGNFMDPSTAWAVNKVAGKSEGKGGYCAVARHFDGNTILTLARNERSETSFALDFPKLKFKPSNSMRITLDPGAGIERDFDVKPVSQKAFVVRLGQDPAFFNALGKTGLLRVEMPDESYVFNISDIDSGQFQLDYCLASLKNKDPAPVPPVESFPTDEMLVAPMKVKAGSDDAAETAGASGGGYNGNALREENERLRAALKNQSKMTPDPIKSAKTDAELSVLKSQLDRAKSDNARLLSMIEEIEGKAQMSEDARIDAAIAEEKIAALQAENNKLQARVQNLSQSLQGYKAVDANKKAWEDEKGLLRNALKKEQEESAEEKAALESALEAEKEKAAQEKSELEEKAAEEKAELEEKVSSLVERNVKLVQTIKGAKSAIGDLAALRDNVEATNSQNAELKAQSVELEQQLASVQEEVEAVTAEKEQQIAKLELEVDRLSEEKQLAEAGASSLEQELASLKEQNEAQAQKLAQSEIELMQLAELKSSNEALYTQLASFQEKFEANKAETKLSQSEIEAENSKLLAENTSLKSQASAMKEALQLAQADISAKITGFNEKVAGLKEQLAEKTAEVMRLASVEGELEAEKAKTERLAALESELAAEKEKTARLASVESELEAEKEKVARLAALEGELDSEKAKTEQLASVEDALAAEKAKNVELEQQVAALEGELQVATASATDTGEHEQVVASLEDENGNLRSLLEKAKTRIEDLVSNADEKAMQLAELKQRNEALEGQLELAASLIENSSSAPAENVEVAATEPVPDVEPKAPEEAQIAEADAPEAGVSADASLETIEEITLAMAPAAPEAPEPKADSDDTAEKTVEEEVVTAEAEYVRDDAFAQANYIPKAKPDVPARMQAAQAEAVEVAEVSAEELANIETAAGDEEAVEAEIKADESADVGAEASVEDEIGDLDPEPTPVLDTQAVMEQQEAARAEAQDFMDRNLSEAQIYEEQMKRKLANEESVTVPSPEVVEEIAPEPMDNVNAELEAMEEAAKAEAAIVKEDAEVVKQVVETPKSVLSSGDLGGASVTTVPQIPSVDEMNAGKVPEQVKQVQQASEKPLAAEMPVVSSDDAPAASSVSAAPLGDVLSEARVASSAVRKVDAASGADVSAYQWRSGAAYGSGEQRVMANAAAFDAYVKEYLTRTESRCNGDFAIVPDNSRQVGSMRIDSYEVACVGAGVSSAAAIVFYNDGATFNVVAHEADAAEMDMVMEIRDKVFATLAGGSKT